MALIVSMQAEEDRMKELEDEEMLMKMVMEASIKEEEARAERVKEVEKKEQEIVRKVAEVSIKEVEPPAKVEDPPVIPP